MKRCSKCKVEKEETEFWARNDRPGKFSSQCRECANARRSLRKELNNETHRKWYAKNNKKVIESVCKYAKENREKVNERHRKWWAENGYRYTEIRKERFEKRTEEQKERKIQYDIQYRKIYCSNNPEKEKARRMLSYYIKHGYMERPTICSKCGENKFIEAHHEDYSKPLDVIWLCKGCHVKLHKEKYESNNNRKS